MLRYRVYPTSDDDETFPQIAADSLPHRPHMDRVRPMAIADGRQALRTVRKQAGRWGIALERIGIMGFSAGGAVAAGAGTGYDGESRPSFAATIYAPWHARPVPLDDPPLFVAAASDDELVDAQSSLALYAAWQAAHRWAELHLYPRGGHGFALIPHGLPADSWIDRFWEWLRGEGFEPSAVAGG